MPKRELREGTERLRGGVEEFVAFDFCGDAHVAVIAGFDANDLAVAMDFHVAGLRHCFRKRDDKFDGIAYFEFCISKKIETAITDVARARVEFRSARLVGNATQREGHHEAPRFAAFAAICDVSSLEGLGSI